MASHPNKCARRARYFVSPSSHLSPSPEARNLFQPESRTRAGIHFHLVGTRSTAAVHVTVSAAMSDAAPPFAGSQFSQITPCAQQQDECIDPALFNLPFENAETHDQATGPTIFHSHSGRALDTSYSPFAQHGCAVTSHDHVLNPQAAPFSPQASPSSDWRIGNSFAPLDPEAPSCLSAYGSPFLQPPHSGRYRNLESSASTYGFQYVPASEHNAAVWSVGAPASYPSAGITFPPLQQDHVNRAFLPSNQPRIASSGISASDVSSWARATYNPGASVHQDSALPVTPTTLTEESRRPSIAPTASTTTSFTCPIDGKEFSRRHEFK